MGDEHPNPDYGYYRLLKRMVYTMKDLTGIIIRMEEYLQIQHLSNITAHGGI